MLLVHFFPSKFLLYFALVVFLIKFKAVIFFILSIHSPVKLEILFFSWGESITQAFKFPSALN